MSEALRRSHPALLGATVGVALGDVLLALNPHLLGPAHVFRLLAGCALVFALVFAPLGFFVKEPGVPSSGFWWVTALLLVFLAAFAEEQRLAYYGFLGNGTRRILVGVTLAGALLPLTAAFAAFRRPRGPAAAAPLLVSLAVFSAVPLLAKPGPDRPALSPPQAIPRTATRSLLVVGLEGISWELLSRAASEGMLPAFARLLEEGAGGPLGALRPYDRAALWTTAATGKLPRAHGVVSGTATRTPLGSFRLLPRLRGLSGPLQVPFFPREERGAAGRRSLAFWEILAARRHEASVLGWPAAEPPRPGLVLWATEAFFARGGGEGTALPPETAARARLLLLGARNLDRSLARALEPAGLSEEEKKAAAAANGAARDLGTLGAAFAAVPAGPASASAIVLAGLAGPARVWGPVAEPQRYLGPSRKDAEAGEKALLAYYRFLDDALGDLLEREGRERTLCVFSPSGFGPSPPAAALWDLLRGHAPEASPAAGDDGFVVLWGSGIRANVRLTSADVADLAPTLLVLAGEPIARDMDGRVLAEVFDERFAQGTSIPVVTTFEPEGSP